MKFKTYCSEKTLVFISLIILSLSGYASDLNKDIQTILNTWRTDNNVPGVVFIINTPNNQETFTSGTTELKGTTPVKADTLFAIGSITKTFISTVVLKLESIGKLNINDPLVKYLPQYTKWKNVTIKQLLNMRSGIPNFSQHIDYKNDLNNNFKKGWTSKQLITLAYEQDVYFEPGKSWNYSNTNYLLLGEIIEKITNSSLDDTLKLQIFNPLNLKHTFYSDTKYPKNTITQMAHGYYNNNDMSKMIPSNIGAAGGGMLMSTLDLKNWINHLFIKQDVVPKKQLSEMLKGVDVPGNSIYPANTKFGLGVLVSHDVKWGDMIWYTGVTPGYSSTFIWVPKEQILIVVQANLNRKNDENFNLLFPNENLIQDVLNKYQK